MAGWTNRGKYLVLQLWARNTGAPTNFYFALGTNTTPPTADSNTMADVSQIAAGNGYSDGGVSVNRNSTDFDVLTEDDTNDRALVQLKDMVFTASGGNLPASGSGARWAYLITDEVTVANRQICHYFDLAADRTVSSGQSLTIQNAELRLNES